MSMLMSNASLDIFFVFCFTLCLIHGYILNQITNSIEKSSVIAAEYGNKVKQIASNFLNYIPITITKCGFFPWNRFIIQIETTGRNWSFKN